MIDFIKRPANGGIPLINLQSNKPEVYLPMLLHIADGLGADSIALHPSYAKFLDLRFFAPLKLAAGPAISLDGAFLCKEGTRVAEVMCLPLTREIMKDAGIK